MLEITCRKSIWYNSTYTIVTGPLSSDGVQVNSAAGLSPRSECVSALPWLNKHVT